MPLGSQVCGPFWSFKLSTNLSSSPTNVTHARTAEMGERHLLFYTLRRGAALCASRTCGSAQNTEGPPSWELPGFYWE